MPWRTSYRGVGGILLFTGYFSLFVGIALTWAGFDMYYRIKWGGVLAFAGGFLGTAVATVNIVMISSKFDEVVGASVSIGYGLYMFLAASIVGLVLGIAVLAEHGGRYLTPWRW